MTKNLDKKFTKILFVELRVKGNPLSILSFRKMIHDFGLFLDISGKN